MSRHWNLWNWYHERYYLSWRFKLNFNELFQYISKGYFCQQNAYYSYRLTKSWKQVIYQSVFLVLFSLFRWTSLCCYQFYFIALMGNYYFYWAPIDLVLNPNVSMRHELLYESQLENLYVVVPSAIFDLIEEKQKLHFTVKIVIFFLLKHSNLCNRDLQYLNMTIILRNFCNQYKELDICQRQAKSVQLHLVIEWKTWYFNRKIKLIFETIKL